MDLRLLMIRAPSASLELSTGRSRSRLGENDELTPTVACLRIHGLRPMGSRRAHCHHHFR